MLAISDLMDVKIHAALQTELQPVKDDIRDLKEHVQSLEQHVNSLEHHMEHRMDSLEHRMDSLEHQTNGLEHRIQKLEQQVSGIQLTLENKTNRDIRLLAENYVPAAKQYERAVIQIESIQTDLDVVKKVVATHSEQLQQLA